MHILLEKQVNTDTIAVTPRPVWKCRNCPEYGLRPSCPPATPDWRESREWVRSYREALLLKYAVKGEDFDPEKRLILLDLLKREKSLFNSHPYAHALFPGSCNLCEACDCLRGRPCAEPVQLRPSVDALGIELTSMVDLDFTESVLYGMIFIQ